MGRGVELEGLLIGLDDNNSLFDVSLPYLGVGQGEQLTAWLVNPHKNLKVG